MDDKLDVVDIRDFKDENITEEFAGGNRNAQEMTKENKNE